MTLKADTRAKLANEHTYCALGDLLVRDAFAGTDRRAINEVGAEIHFSTGEKDVLIWVTFGVQTIDIASNP